METFESIKTLNNRLLLRKNSELLFTTRAYYALNNEFNDSISIQNIKSTLKNYGFNKNETANKLIASQYFNHFFYENNSCWKLNTFSEVCSMFDLPFNGKIATTPIYDTLQKNTSFKKFLYANTLHNRTLNWFEIKSITGYTRKQQYNLNNSIPYLLVTPNFKAYTTPPTFNKERFTYEGNNTWYQKLPNHYLFITLKIDNQSQNNHHNRFGDTITTPIYNKQKPPPFYNNYHKNKLSRVYYTPLIVKI